MSIASPVQSHRLMAILLLTVCVSIPSLLIWRMDDPEDRPALLRAVMEPPRQNSGSTPVTSQVVAAATNQVTLRPLPVSRSSSTHDWTSDDAMDPKVIAKLAHNPDEFIRLNEENERIKRRQLVYRKETLPMLLDQARNSGEPLRSFTLPGLDGMEVEVEVTGTQLNQAGNGGSVTGQVKGRFNSMVSVGFANGCESFNVLSPDDGLFLTADAREPGEVIVKEIDPIKYNPPAGTTPDFILTNQPSPRTNTQ